MAPFFFLKNKFQFVPFTISDTWREKLKDSSKKRKIMGILPAMFKAETGKQLLSFLLANAKCM